MNDNDENEFCSFQEENNESDYEKISIFADNDEESISTAVNQNQNESEDANKKDVRIDEKDLNEGESNPNLCEIILENLNRKRKPDSTIQIADDPINPDVISTNSSSILPKNTCEKREKRYNRFQSNFLDKHFDSEINVNEENLEKISVKEDNNNILNKENIDSINHSLIENINVPEKTKVPMLLNTLEAIYDMNSDRNKKRVEQMKNRKKRLGSKNKELQKSFEEENKPVKIKVLSTKKFQDEDSAINNVPKEEPEVTFPLMTKDEKENENEKEENIEIVVSDLEGEIEDKIVIHNTNSSKSFIPITNHLKSKSSSTLDKATPSYLMALGLDGDDNDEESAGGENNPSEKNTNNNLVNKQNNYFVADVIEEETSENNTDSEIPSYRIKMSHPKEGRGSSIISENISIIESPTILSPRSPKKENFIQEVNHHETNEDNSVLSKITSPTEIRQIRYSNSDIPYGPYHNEENPETLNEYYHNGISKRYVADRLINKYTHKNSKSEFFYFQVDMNKIIENIQKKIQEQGNKRKELMKLRKNILLNKFLKSNSHHNFAGNYNISAPSLSIYKQNQLNKFDGKIRSICLPNSNYNENFLRKINPSEISQGVYYQNDLDCQKIKVLENTKEIKSILENDKNLQEIEHDIISFNSGTREKIVDYGKDLDEMELNVDDLDGNRSIIVEKGDEDINFESELNFQLEKNDLNSEYNEDHFNTNENDMEPENDNEKICIDSNPVNHNQIQLLQRYKHLSFDKNATKQIQLPSINNLNPLQNFPTLKKNYFKVSEREKETNQIKYNNKFLNSFLTKDKFSGRSNSLTFLSPIRTTPNKLTQNKGNTKIKTKLEIAKAAILQITPTNHITNSIFNHNYINNNINNISINILNNDFKARHGLNNNKKNNFKSNSITNEIKNKFALHVKSSSAFLLKPKLTNELRTEAKSCPKNLKTGQGLLDSSSKIKKGLKYSELIASRKTKLLMHKKDLKQFLTFTDSRPNLSNMKPKSLFNYSTQLNPSYSSSNFNRLNQKFNSDHYAQNLIKSSNKLIIMEAMKSLRFQFSSLDHQKFALDRLNRSKAKFFCLLISKEFRFQNFEFKGLYEINYEKNCLTKIYSVNAYPNQIEYEEIKKFYYFNSEYNSFELLIDQHKLSHAIHAVSTEFSFKNILKQYISGK